MPWCLCRTSRNAESHLRTASQSLPKAWLSCAPFATAGLTPLPLRSYRDNDPPTHRSISQLANLVSNALKFTEASGSVVIRMEDGLPTVQSVAEAPPASTSTPLRHQQQQQQKQEAVVGSRRGTGIESRSASSGSAIDRPLDLPHAEPMSAARRESSSGSGSGSVGSSAGPGNPTPLLQGVAPSPVPSTGSAAAATGLPDAAVTPQLQQQQAAPPPAEVHLSRLRKSVLFGASRSGSRQATPGSAAGGGGGAGGGGVASPARGNDHASATSSSPAPVPSAPWPAPAPAGLSLATVNDTSSPRRNGTPPAPPVMPMTTDHHHQHHQQQQRESAVRPQIEWGGTGGVHGAGLSSSATIAIATKVPPQTQYKDHRRAAAALSSSGGSSSSTASSKASVTYVDRALTSHPSVRRLVLQGSVRDSGIGIPASVSSSSRRCCCSNG